MAVKLQTYRFILEPDEFHDIFPGALPGARWEEIPPPDGVAAKVLVENVLTILFQGAVDKFVHGPFLAVSEWIIVKMLVAHTQQQICCMMNKSRF